MVDVSEQLPAQMAERATEAAQSWRPGVRIGDVQPLTGGYSSLTFTAQARGGGDDTTLVLKVAPPGLEPRNNRDMLRQATVLRALHGRPGVLVPEVHFSAGGRSLDEPPFLAMALVPGECVEPLFEPRPPSRPVEEIRGRALDAARMLAALHRVVPEEAGLGGGTTTDLRAEIDRWTRAFETLPDEMRGRYERCAQALHDTLPEAMPPAVTHGDFRLGNTLCQGPKVTAIIDWEIWAVGDPRVDLSWFTFFTDEAAHPSTPADEPSGMPTAAELLDAYKAVAGVELTDLAWFDALTRYKESAATGLIVKRAMKRGEADDDTKATMAWLPRLVEEALELLGRA